MRRMIAVSRHVVEVRVSRGSKPKLNRTWSVALWSTLLLGVLLAGALFEPRDDTLLRKALLDAAHAPLGGALAYLSLQWILAWEERSAPTRRDQLLALAAAVLSGLLFEILQLFLSRDADVVDLWRDTLGSMAFLLLAWATRRRKRPAPGAGKRLLAGGTAVVLLAVAGVSAARVARAVVQRDAAFPVLCEPGASWLRPFLALQHVDWELTPRPPAWAESRPGKQSASVARVTFHRGPFPGFALRETAPDWRGYATLSLEVYSSLHAPIDVVLRIDDARHDGTFGDRFNQSLTVVPGGQTFRIPIETIRLAPATRQMDMRHIRRLVIFAIETQEPFTLDFGRIDLE